jgi:peptidoglycan/xylan/chitin deacetylase (PgdA/CDA1 family)
MVLFDRYPGGKRYACTFSYDDGGEQDIRLVELFNKYGMKCTFNLYSRVLHDSKRAICLETLKDIYAGHEIASHAYSHPHLEKMPLKLQYDEVIKDREAIEPVWGEIIRGFAYPFGTFSDDTKLALKTAGIVYARTVNSAINSFAPPNDFLEWNPTTHHNESADAIRRFIYNVEKAPWRAGGLLYIWGHSYEFDNERAPVKWAEFEERLKVLADHSYDIWFGTNAEVYDYLQAMKSIRVSADGKMYYNPTDTDVWVSNGDENVKIGACQKVIIE